MRVSVENDRIDESQRKAHSAIEGALRDGALETQGEAQRLAPVDTGRLRASITTRDSGPLTWEVYTNVDYAGYVESGTGIYAPGGRRTPWVYEGAHGFVTTRGNPAQPFMRPAYERYRLPTIERARAALQNI